MRTRPARLTSGSAVRGSTSSWYMRASARALVKPPDAPISVAARAAGDSASPGFRKPPLLNSTSAGIEVGSVSASSRKFGNGGAGGSAGMIGASRRELAVGQAHREVDPEPVGHLVAEELAERLARDPPHELADQESERQRVIAVARAGLPERRLGGERLGHELVVVERAGRQRIAHRGDAGLVGEQHRDRRCLLAVLPVLGPVVDDRSVEVEQAARGQDVRAQRGRALGARPDVDDRVLLASGSAVSTRAVPPQRSITRRPPAMTDTAAPTSPRSVKFRMNSSRTRLNRRSQTPETMPPAGSRIRRASPESRGRGRGPAAQQRDASAPAAAPSSRRRRERSTVGRSSRGGRVGGRVDRVPWSPPW